MDSQQSSVPRNDEETNSSLARTFQWNQPASLKNMTRAKPAWMSTVCATTLRGGFTPHQDPHLKPAQNEEVA